MFTVNGTEQHNDIVKPLYSVQATLIVSLGPFQTSCYCRVAWQGLPCYTAVGRRLKQALHSFFFYKNIEAEICEILRIF